MQCRRPCRHEKTFQEPKGEAEGDERNIVQFPERRKAIPPSNDFFGTEESELSTNKSFAGEPKLELLPLEKILLGAAAVVAAIMLGLLLLLLMVEPPSGQHYSLER
jgi:hypothetical protein